MVCIVPWGLAKWLFLLWKLCLGIGLMVSVCTLWFVRCVADAPCTTSDGYQIGAFIYTGIAGAVVLALFVSFCCTDWPAITEDEQPVLRQITVPVEA